MKRAATIHPLRRYYGTCAWQVLRRRPSSSGVKTFEEMAGNAFLAGKAVNTVVGRLKAIPEYRALFAKAFGGANTVTAGDM